MQESRLVSVKEVEWAVKWQRQLPVSSSTVSALYESPDTSQGLSNPSPLPLPPPCVVPLLQGHGSQGLLNMRLHIVIFAKLSFQELWAWVQYDSNYLQCFCFPFITFTMKERNSKYLHIYLMFSIEIALTDLILSTVDFSDVHCESLVRSQPSVIMCLGLQQRFRSSRLCLHGWTLGGTGFSLHVLHYP